MSEKSNRSRPGPAAALAITSLLTLVLHGCTGYADANRDVQHAVSAWRRQSAPLPPAAIFADRRAATTAASTSDDAPPVEAVARPMDGYIRIALQRNPSIQAAAASAQAKLARIPQATALPDPLLRMVVRPEPIQTAAGDMEFTLGISQALPWPALLQRAGDAATAETRMALAELLNQRLRVIADVERAFWQIYRLDRDLEITRANLDLLGDLESVVSLRYEVGEVPQQDLLRVQTERGRLRDRAHRDGMHRAAAAAALNQLMDTPPSAPIPATVTAGQPAVAADVEKLLALAAEHNPAVARLREQVIRDEALAEKAEIDTWPRVALGLEWNYLDGRDAFVPPINPATGQRPPVNRKSEAGDDNWAITLQLNIPIWAEPREAAKREARQNLLATQGALRSAENRSALRIFDAWSRVEAQQQTLRTLAGELIPLARQAYEVSLATYQAGETDFLDVIDNWRRWLDFERMQHRETADLEIAFAEMQRDVGLQLIYPQEAKTERPGANPDAS